MNSDYKSTGLLLEQIQKGNHKAFKKLYCSLWDRMFHKAKSMVRCAEASKDIVQEIWMDLWSKREVRNIKNIEAYLMRAVVTGCLRYLSSNKLKSIHSEVIESIAIPQSPEIENSHNLEALKLAINGSLERLTPRSKEVFLLNKFEDKSNQDIAAKLDISKKTVENHLSTALRIVRNSIAGIVSILILQLGFL